MRVIGIGGGSVFSVCALTIKRGAFKHGICCSVHVAVVVVVVAIMILALLMDTYCSWRLTVVQPVHVVTNSSSSSASLPLLFPL